MADDGPSPLRYTDGRNRRSRWRHVLPASVCLAAAAILFDGRTVQSDDMETRACLEPVYAGLFGTGPRALERCLRDRPRLFGADDAGKIFARRTGRVLDALSGIEVEQSYEQINTRSHADGGGDPVRTMARTFKGRSIVVLFPVLSLCI